MLRLHNSRGRRFAPRDKIHKNEVENMRAKTYACDDCGRKDEFSSYIKARAAGWAVAKDYSKCYCPACAPSHRRGGAKYKQRLQSEFPKEFQQLDINDIK